MRNFIKRPKALYKAYSLLALALLAIPVSANAALVTWSINNVAFGDGGTASGSFAYDASTNTFSNIAVTTTAGSIYSSGASYASGGGNINFFKFYSTSSFVLGTTRQLYIDFYPYMTDAGGTSPIGGVIESVCESATCLSPSSSRSGASGNDLDSISSTAPVPLPAAVWLMLSGLGGLGFLRKRKAA